MIKTLLIDDEKSFLGLAKTYLEKENEELKIETINSPKKALKLIKTGSFDCVVCDYQMPELNGLKVLEKVRNELNSDISFIMFTGKGREEVAMKALNFGADRYLQKGGDSKTQFGVLAQVIIQVVEHYTTKEALEEREEKYRRLVETTGNIILTHDENGKIEFINQAGLNFSGYSEKEVENKNIKDFIPQEEIPDLLERKKERKKKKNRERLNFETKFINKKGKKIDVYVESTPIIENGEFKGELIIARDITERKKREEKLKEKEQRLKTHLSQTPAVIYTYKVVDGTPETTYVSESVRDVLGHDPEYYTSDPQNFLNDLHPEDKQRLFEKEEKLLTDEKTDSITVKYRFKDKEGNYHWLRDEEKILSEEDDNQKVIGAWWDITERKEAEKRENFLHSLLRHDLRNKSQIVQGYLDLIQDHNLAGEVEEYVSKAIKATEEGIEVIEKVRTLREIEEQEEIKEIDLDSGSHVEIEYASQTQSDEGQRLRLYNPAGDFVLGLSSRNGVEENDTYSIEEDTESGYWFISVDEGYGSGDGDYSFNVLVQEEITEFDLTINKNGAGSTNPSTGTHTYEEGEEITITATPESGWGFNEWTGDATGTDEEITITMDEDKEITANFEEETPKITKQLEIEIVSEEEDLLKGEEIEFRVTTDGETVEDATISNGETVAKTGTNGLATLTFNEAEEYTVTVEKDDEVVDGTDIIYEENNIDISIEESEGLPLMLMAIALLVILAVILLTLFLIKR